VLTQNRQLQRIISNCELTTESEKRSAILIFSWLVAGLSPNINDLRCIISKWMQIKDLNQLKRLQHYLAASPEFETDQSLCVHSLRFESP
jgi:hypothetical protein